MGKDIKWILNDVCRGSFTRREEEPKHSTGHVNIIDHATKRINRMDVPGSKFQVEVSPHGRKTVRLLAF